MRKHLSCALAPLLLLACDKPSASPAPPSETPEPVALSAAQAIAEPIADAGTPEPTEPELHHGLPWYADAIAPALASVRGTDKLLLVDLWAAWCHTCLSMRAHVLTADNLAPVRERLSFVAIDTEKAGNAELLAQLSIAAWPTFYLLDAERRVYGRWIGAASPSQLVSFVKDGLTAYDRQKGGALAAGDPLALLVAGDRLAARGQLAEARGEYERALATAPPGWARRPDVLVALAGALRKSGDLDACVKLGQTALNDTGQAASATDFGLGVLTCAETRAKSDATKRPALDKLARAVEQKLAPLCTKGSPLLSPDDRGDACGAVRELRHERGDEKGARAAAIQRLSVLETAAKGLPDDVAHTYDFARAESLVQLGRGDDAVALLKAREEALPRDYSPSHFLARVLRDLGRHEEALPAVQRALDKSQGQGPRRAGILGVHADVLIALGRKDEARAVVEAQLAAYRALPEGQRQPAREESVAARLASWK
ncbi:MAG: tetratricopeptide repeat protein [Polyangiales bacterium]